MNTKNFVADLIGLLEKAKEDDEYINPHIISSVVSAIEETGEYEVPYDICKWVSDMWGW